jgi:hypothetical protein
MPKAPRTFGADPYRTLRYERARRDAKPWRSWYGSKRWKDRAEQQLANEPLCRMHKAKGRAVVATVADHVVPHRGDAELFWEGELQSLCTRCHSSTKQREERAAAGHRLSRR